MIRFWQRIASALDLVTVCCIAEVVADFVEGYCGGQVILMELSGQR